MKGGKRWQGREGQADSGVLAKGLLSEVIQGAAKNKEITLALISSAAF